MHKPGNALVRGLALAGGAALGVSAMSAAHAQESATSGGFDEIVVTAQKREQDLMQVGVTLSVLSGDLLQERGVEQLSDLAPHVANLNIKNTLGATNPVVTIRGVGLNDFNANNNPTAGVYVDEVFLTSTAMMGFQLFDMQRVEVLKGPQGTLYGRNTTAGAVSFVTRQPSQTPSGYVNFGYGAHQTFVAEGAAGGPLGDNLAFRLSGRVEQQEDGFSFDRVSGQDFGKADRYAWRAQLAWDNGPASVSLNLHGGRDRSNSFGIEHFGTVDPDTFGTCQAILDGHVDPSSCIDFLGYSDTDGEPYAGDYDLISRVNIDSFGALARVRIDFGAAEFVSITGYETVDREQAEDYDASPARALNSTWDAGIEQVSQELRLSSTADSGPSWIVGAFYSRDDVDTGAGNQFDSTDLLATILSTDWRQRTESAAAFAHVEWPLSDRLSLVTGVRYTWEKKRFRGGSTDLNPYGTSCLLDPGCAPGFVGPFALSSVDSSIDTDNVSGKLGLEYHPNADWLWYASVSRGFKSGGFFGGVTLSNDELAPFRPEELTAYEAGVRARLANDTLRVSGAVFYYDYSDIQTFVQVPVGGLSVLRLDNVKEASVTGLDLEAHWRPTDRWDIELGFGYIDTELGAFESAIGTQPKGNELPNAPPLTVNAALSYEWPVAQGLVMSATVDASYSDDVFKEAVNFRYLSSDSYSLLNARLALRGEGERWEVSVFGRNLTDEAYIVDAFDNGIGNGVRLYGEPRTYGVLVTYRWNE